MPDLSYNLAFWSFYRYLYITGYREHIITFKAVASAHSIKTVIQPEIFRFSNIQNSLHDSLVIHSLFPLSWNVT